MRAARPAKLLLRGLALGAAQARSCVREAAILQQAYRLRKAVVRGHGERTARGAGSLPGKKAKALASLAKHCVSLRNRTARAPCEPSARRALDTGSAQTCGRLGARRGAARWARVPKRCLTCFALNWSGGKHLVRTQTATHSRAGLRYNHRDGCSQ